MIVNLTQHDATPEQVAAGVVDLPEPMASAVRRLLTFDEIPARFELAARAGQIAQIAAGSGFDAAMIGGAPFFMAHLEAALLRRGIQAMYAFSRRESVEEIGPDGSVRKTSIFRHAGFVPGPVPVPDRESE